MSEKRDLSWLIKMTFLAILILARHAVSEVCDGVVFTDVIILSLKCRHS